MSYTFSRRDFMKYSAVAAVAVAGSSMFTGCSLFSNPNRPVGVAGSKLSPGGKTCEATLLNGDTTKPKYDGNVLTCNFTVKATQPSLEVTESHFQVDVTINGNTKSYYYMANSTGVTVSLDNGTGTKALAAGASCSPVLKVSGLANLNNASKILVRYWPLNAAKNLPTDSYNDVYATWDITDVIVPASAGTTQG